MTRSWKRPKPRLMRTRSPSRTARFGWAWSPLTSTLPPSQARFASDRVLNRHATSSHTSSRWDSTVSDEDFDLTLRAEAVHEGRGLLLAVARPEELLDLGFHFVKRHRSRRLLLDDLDDVITEIGLDDVADRARFETERRVVEGPDHLSLLKEAEVTAVGGAARILGVLLGERREVLAGLRVLENRLGFCPRLRFRGRVSILGRGDQDVARVHLLRLLELLRVLGVESLDVFGLDGDLRCNRLVHELRHCHLLPLIRLDLIEGEVLLGERLLERVFGGE